MRYLLEGVEPSLTEERLASSTDRLFEDLDRLSVENIEFSRNTPTSIPRVGVIQAPILARYSAGEMVIGLHAPLTQSFAADKHLRRIADSDVVHLADEIVVARNLPHASQQVREKLERLVS